MDRIDVAVEMAGGVKVVYTGYTGAPLTATVRVRCFIEEREDDCLRVWPETFTSSVWVHDSDVEIYEGESEIGWLSCFLDEILDDWVIVTVPSDAKARRIAVPFSSLDRAAVAA